MKITLLKGFNMTDITWIYTFLGELLVFIAILIVILFIIAIVFGRMFIKKGMGIVNNLKNN